jgi:transposase-like protein
VAPPGIIPGLLNKGATVRTDTKLRKIASKGFRAATGEEWIQNKMFEVMKNGKQALDIVMLDIGRKMAETFLLMDREDQSGPDYAPTDPCLKKWASQAGSVFIGDQKVKVQVPRIRHLAKGEIPLQSYQQMKKPGQFSEEMLHKVLCGISERKYEETVLEGAKAFGVSASSNSRRIVEITTKKRREFAERDLSAYHPFTVYIDTVHRGKEAFIVALGIDLEGNKQALGFWQGGTENAVISNQLLSDLERRRLKPMHRILWVTDGGSGVIKCLKDRFGSKLIHQRCTIHKDRNIQKHLAKTHRKEAHRQYRIALEQESYKDARKMLLDFERWLRVRNESAANSLLEALDEILTLHRLQVPALLRKTLHSTNPIESMFSMVRHCEHNIKRYRNSKMMQRWLASVLLHCEKSFRKVKGYESINQVVKNILNEQENSDTKNIQIKAA